MFNLGCADAVGQGTKRAMSRCVAVPTHNGHAWQCPTLFWANDVNNPLTHVRYGIVVNSKILGVFVKRLNLDAALFVFDHTGRAIQSCRNVVIWNRNRFVRCVN